MISSLRDALSALSGAAVSFALVSVYWLGIPLVNDRSTIPLPFVGDLKVSSLPLLGPLAVGHLQLRIDQAVAAATVDMVERVELEALKEKLAETRRQHEAGAQALEEYRRRAAEAQSAAAEAEVQMEQERMAYEIRLDQAQRRCVLDDADIDWLRRHDR